MTKKEKKEMALQIKAEIEARKPKPAKKEIMTKEQMEKDNQRRRQQDKAKNRKGGKDQLGYKSYKHLDFDKW